MYQACQAYLIERLKAAGIKTEVFTSQKDLDNNEEQHKAAVIAESDTVAWDGSKVVYTDDAGAKHKRTRKMTRKIAYIVTIGEYTAAACEQLYTAFLAGLAKGIYVDANWVAITLEPAQWYDEQDRIIKASVAVVCKVVFDGGVYRDTDYKQLSEIVTSVEREDK